MPLHEQLLDLAADAYLETGLISGQQRSALRAADVLTRAVGDTASIEFTGHSLGGHLATIQALAFGAPATVFNPAGLNDRTVERLNLDSSNAKNVTRYVVPGELADNLQGSRTIDALSAILLTAPTNAISLGQSALGKDPLPYRFGVTTIPEAIGNKVTLPVPSDYSGLLGLHSTDALLAALSKPLPALAHQSQ